MDEQHELYENARIRIKQKKRLYQHFVLFLIGSVFLIVLNKLLKFGEAYNWFVWVILFWLFLWVLHVVNVFITHPFMGKEWERKQTKKLLQKQELKIAKLEKEIAHKAQLKAKNEHYAAELNKKEKPQENSTEE